MIALLSEEEKKYVTKPQLVKMEEEILSRFGFDFNF